jgi:dCTP diphosphatase
MDDSIKVLSQEISDFSKERNWDQFHSPANLAKSISIEAGELLECFQWDENNYDKEAVEEELADVINYSLGLASALHLDVKEIVEKKMVKNAKKYPVEKCKGKSTKYDKL